jgi:hypothetical protein
MIPVQIDIPQICAYRRETGNALIVPRPWLVCHWPLAAFVRTAVLREADRTVAAKSLSILSASDSRRFLAALSKPFSPNVVSKILYLRERYRFGTARITSHLHRFHKMAVARSTVHRILIRYGMNRLPANRRRRPTGRAGVLSTACQGWHRRRYPSVQRQAARMGRLLQLQPTPRRPRRADPLRAAPGSRSQTRAAGESPASDGIECGGTEESASPFGR